MELEELWKSFSLSDQERAEVEIPQEEVAREVGKGKLCIMVLVIYERMVNKEAFRFTMAKVWSTVGWVQFKEMGHNKFLVEFQLQQDKQKVLQGRPWTFDRFLVCMEDLEGTLVQEGPSFSYEVFWIQIHNMPLVSMTHEIGQKLGSGVGSVIEVDYDGSSNAWGPFLRMKVKIDITRPLCRGRLLKLDDKQVWLPFKYERLPSFCFQCGTIKHKEGGCSKGSRGIYGKTSCDFGPWLRANPPKAGSTSTKRYEGGGRSFEHQEGQQDKPEEDGQPVNEKQVPKFQDTAADTHTAAIPKKEAQQKGLVDLLKVESLKEGLTDTTSISVDKSCESSKVHVEAVMVQASHTEVLSKATKGPSLASQDNPKKGHPLTPLKRDSVTDLEEERPPGISKKKKNNLPWENETNDDMLVVAARQHHQGP
ncbi:uncharacterized protein LOC121253336 [Juglans microcarpa x Juglans regia]|uniref:uncharacterized protein LOC121253336 n=1 Tax=Juglans microcarpa x Juglans regia TaxID=2249226 RepID=UPI001B7E6758|nr:uncharacterized protein LOC121253336 [Juglans microcarpa x Juglans regia]